MPSLKRCSAPTVTRSTGITTPFSGGLSSTDKCKVTYADSVWFREGQINVRPEFLQANADWFGADAYAAPFDASTVKDINTWVKKNTDGMIDSILDLH